MSTKQNTPEEIPYIVQYTVREGGEWMDINMSLPPIFLPSDFNPPTYMNAKGDTVVSHRGGEFHALRLSNGDEWDCITGYRPKAVMTLKSSMNPAHGITIMNPFKAIMLNRSNARKEIVIYHANCADGFAAAWCFHDKEPGKYEFIAASYGDAPPDCTDAIVYMVDFSYKRDVVKEICKVARKVYHVDHHISAIEDLESIWKDPNHEDFRGNFGPYQDINYSGAMLAWKFLYGSASPAPLLLKHIQDRDLWQFKMPGTKEISAALFSYDWTFSLFDDLMLGTRAVEDLTREGVALLRKHTKDVRQMVDSGMQLGNIDGYIVPTLNASPMFSSDAGNLMATEYEQGKMFAATYIDGPKGRIFSLRSTKDGMDVSKIAERFGGGGHKNAAGFTIQVEHHPIISTDFTNERNDNGQSI
jgi:hypothetical protein